MNTKKDEKTQRQRVEERRKRKILVLKRMRRELNVEAFPLNIRMMYCIHRTVLTMASHDICKYSTLTPFTMK